MHDHLSTFKPLNLKFVKRFSEDFIYQNQDLSNPLLQVLESNIGASGHSTKPLPACPRLKWAAPQPLNRTSPSNLYKSQKLLSLNVESPLLPVFHRQVSRSQSIPTRGPELMGSLKLGNVWIFVQLFHRPLRNQNQLYKNPNIA